MDVKNQCWSQDLRLPCFNDASTIISQLEPFKYTPIPFQSKHLSSLKRNVWFALKRPADRSRSGLLCIWPAKKCCIFVIAPRVALLRLRVDPHFFEEGVGFTVFSATLSASTKTLSIEDTIAWKGRQLLGDTFTKRLHMAKQWLDHFCIADSRLMNGITLEIAQWVPLSSVRPTGVWNFMADDSRQSLIWVVPNMIESPDLDKVPQVPQVPQVPVALATRESGPDQWSLKSASQQSLGRALIRNLDISAALRSSGSSVFLEVGWNNDFNKWEAISIVSGPATNFDSPK